MEMDFSGQLLVGVIVSCLIWIWGSKHWQTGKKLNLPPGPSGLSAIFDSICLLRAYLRTEVQPYLEEQKRKFGPVFRTSFLGYPMVFLNGPDAGRCLVSNDRDLRIYYNYNVRKVLIKPGGLLNMGPERHRQVKRFLATRILGPECVPFYVDQSELLAKEYFEKFWLNCNDGTVVNIHELINGLFSYVVVKQFLSLTDDQESRTLQGLLATLERTVISFVPLKVPGTAFYRSYKARAEITKTVEAALRRRRKDLVEGSASPTQDILSRMIAGNDALDKPLFKDQEIVTVLVDLLLPANLTAPKLVTTIIRDVGKRPETYEKLIHEHDEIISKKKEGQPLDKQDLDSMVLTSQVILESLRIATRTELIPPALREAVNSFDYQGYTIPKGWKVSIPYGQVPDNAKHDPSRWEQPHAGAAPYSLKLFGVGSKRCPGEDYAKMNALVFLHCFLKSVRWELVDTPENVQDVPLFRSVEMLAKVYRRVPTA